MINRYANKLEIKPQITTKNTEPVEITIMTRSTGGRGERGGGEAEVKVKGKGRGELLMLMWVV